MNEIKTFCVWMCDGYEMEHLKIKAATPEDAREIAERGVIGAYFELIEEETEPGIWRTL